jgi:DNA-binding beta-propeller fold protein YncE
VGAAQGTWSVISLPNPTKVGHVSAMAVEPAGNLYVYGFDWSTGGRIQKRDAQSNWSVIATEGYALGQVRSPTALAVDPSGTLYVAEWHGDNHRIQKRDAQGNWSVLATDGQAIGQVSFDSLYRYGAGLAVDAAGNLYVAEAGNNRVQKFTPLP